MDKVLVTPHLRCDRKTRGIMTDVAVALIPTLKSIFQSFDVHFGILISTTCGNFMVNFCPNCIDLFVSYSSKSFICFKKFICFTN